METQHMHPDLRNFLEMNGLDKNATEEQAWAQHRALIENAVEYNGPVTTEPETRAESTEQTETRAETSVSAPAPAQPSAEEIQRMVADAARAERTRVEEIRSLCSYFDLPEEKTRALVNDNQSVDSARAAILAHLQSQGTPLSGRSPGNIQMGLDAAEKFRAAAIDGVLMQSGIRKANPAPGASDFRGLSPIGMARACLERAGVNCSMMSSAEIARRALIPHSTSDFPLLLTGVGRETLLAGYQEAPQSWRPFVATASAPDFRDMYAYRFGGGFDLKQVQENGEYETVDAVESGEKYRITRAGRVFPYTYEMLVNDKWGVLTSVTRRFGAAALRMETQMVYAALTGTGNMSDGKPLFDASHNNLMKGKELATSALEEAIQKLWETRGEGGEFLDLQPAYLLVSPADKFKADVLIGSTASVTAQLSSGVVNPLAGMVQIITDPRISKGWYLFSSPSQAPVLEAAWLDGNEAPYIEEQPDFITDGVRIKCRHCFGVGVIGYRGAIHNPGA